MEGVGPVAVWPAGRDALQGLGEPGERIEAVHLCGLEKCGDGRPRSSAAIGSGEDCVPASNGLWLDGALDGIGVDVETTVVQEAFERASSRLLA
jgi:hypothetical protein